MTTLSAKTEYACIALLELSLRYGSDKPVRIRDIADANGIPARFLVQILLQLKGAGLVTSIRGAAGGYQLARPPEDITLGDIVAITEGQAAEVQSNADNQTPVVQTLLTAWRSAAVAQQQILTSVTFSELADRVRGHTQMYYI